MVIAFPRRNFLFCTLSMCIFYEQTKSLKLLELDVPKTIALGTRATLSCCWQLGPADVLYSVKWYKDGKEFFRHVPRDIEPRRRFPLPGVDVEDSDTLGSKLVLSPATLKSGGRYRCEVSGERPLFPTVSDHADMDVVALPEHGPIIYGFHSKYRIGDSVRINCTSGHSQPATQLSWYINGEPLSAEQYSTGFRSQNALIVTNSMLEFQVTQAHFIKNVLKVKCLAIIPPLYWKSNEETTTEEKNTILLDIETISQKAKRAEGIHANIASLCTSNLYLNALNILTCSVVLSFFYIL